jgi:hypothetical protein
LDSSLDAVVVAHGRLVRRRPHAHSSSNSDAHSYSRANSNSDAESNSNSGHRMQRDSDLDRDRDLYRRAARKLQRLHLRSQVVESKPESSVQLRPRWPMAAHRLLRHDADSNSNSYSNSYTGANANTTADRDV